MPLLPEIFHILRYKLLAFMKVSVDWKLEGILKNVGSFLVYTGFTIGAFFLTRNTIGFLLEQAHVGLFLLHRFLSMLLYVFFLSINVGNIIVSYSTLYKSNEVWYLLTKPVSHTSLFVIKFLDNFFYSSTTLFVVGIAVLAGYGSHFHLPWTFYVWVVVLLFIPFMFLAAVIGVMMLFALIKLAQRFGARLVVASLSLVYVSSIYAFFTLTNPMKLVGAVMRYYPNINQYFGFLDPPFSKFLPNHWVAESLYWTVAGDVSRVLPHVALLFGVCLVVSVVAVILARRWYYDTWLAFLSLRLQREDSTRASRFFHLAKDSRLEPQTEVLLKKELHQFFREPSQWIHLCVILFLVATFIATISQIEIAEGNPFLRAVSYLVVFLFNAFMISSIALRFIYPMVSIEGEAFWKTRSAPIALNKVAMVKFAISFLLTLVIGLALNAFSRPLRLPASLQTPTFANVAFITLAMAALSFGMGSLFATFKERNPIRVASSQGASLTFLLSLIYLVFLIAVLFIPVNRYFESQAFGSLLPESLFLTATLAIGATSILIAGASWFVTIRALKRDL